jgi:Putative enzyme of poly-gamma-glutamate biosynthesis (capsule formation)
MKIHFTLLLFLSLNSCAWGQEQKVSFLFAGDAMQHKTQLDVAKTKDGYDYSAYFKHVEDEIKQADIAVVNFETTLPGEKYTGYPRFGSPDEFAFTLKDVGFDVFLTANNHILDKDKKGLEVTKPNIVNYIDRKQILKDIDQVKLMQADIIIANVRWRGICIET